MKYLLSSLILIGLLSCQKANDGELRQLLQAQVTAFNSKQVSTLVGNVSKDIKWFSVLADSSYLEVNGKAQFEESMLEYYKHIKTIESSILDHCIQNNKISFVEEVRYETTEGVTGLDTSMGVYLYKDGLIYRVYYFY